MKDLYMQTENGQEKIDNQIVNKYNLEKGLKSPFTRKPITDENGSYLVFHPETKEMMEHPDDGIAQMEHGLMLSTSEMLDIASGVDSDVEKTI